MLNPFEHSEDAGRHIKIGVRGPPSSGKTAFGLDAKNHGLGPVAVISLEAGEVMFKTSKRWGGFKSIRTNSIPEMEKAIGFLESNPGVFGTLVVDTITGIYEALVDAKMKDDGSMDRNVWGQVKRAWKSLMLRLTNLPLHVVFVVHELEITEQDARGNARVVGYKSDAEKSFARAPDFMLRMTMGDDGKPVGQVLKLRGEDLPFTVGQKIVEPHLGMFVPAIKAGTETRVSLPSEVARENEAAIGAGTAAHQAPPPPADTRSPVEIAAALCAQCAEGFAAKPHRDNWIKKHKAEIDALPEDLKEQVRVALRNAPMISRDGTKPTPAAVQEHA